MQSVIYIAMHLRCSIVLHVYDTASVKTGICELPADRTADFIVCSCFHDEVYVCRTFISMCVEVGGNFTA